MITPLQSQAIDLLELIEKKENEYFQLNRELIEVQGDFPSHIAVMDQHVHPAVLNLIDAILANQTASWYLYEMPKSGGVVTDEDGTKFFIEDISSLRAYYNRKKEI